VNIRGRFATFRTLSFVAALLLARTNGVAAVNVEPGLFQLNHTSWTGRDGAPTGVLGLAQTSDGYLWIGSLAGLFRFDGVRFERFKDTSDFALPSDNITALFAPKSGGLWIGYASRGASFVHNGHISNYSEGEGLGPQKVFKFGQSDDGTMWAATVTGLMQFSGTRWQRAGAERHFHSDLAQSVAVDLEGTLWVGTADTVEYLKKGSAFFEQTGVVGIYPTVAAAPDGGVWQGDGSMGVRRLRVSAQGIVSIGPWVVHTESIGALVDDHGSLWVYGLSGLYRIARPPSDGSTMSPAEVENFNLKDGLSGNAYFMLEDREKNVWVGTASGLDRFRHVPFARVSSPSGGGFIYTLATRPDGAMWMDDDEHHIMEVRDYRVKTLDGPRHLSYFNTDSSGVTWAGMSLGGAPQLWRYADSGWRQVPLPGLITSHAILAAASDAAGGLWVSITIEGLYHFVNGQWTSTRSSPDLPHEFATTISADFAQRLWFGFKNDRAVLFDGKTYQTFTSADGLSIGDVLTVSARRRYVWAGGTRGWSRFDGHRFSEIALDGGSRFHGVSGIIETADGDIWLNTFDGVARIAESEIRHSIADPKYPVRFDMFSYSDGIPGAKMSFMGVPSAVEGTDGRLWFAFGDGVAWVDPNHIVRNELIPPVWIQTENVEGVRQHLTNGARLPLGTHRLQITYTALSLSAPERVHFKYQLEGIDTGWQDGGSQRTASYFNLGPGNYRFWVIASNENNVWNTTGDSLEFTIPPRFYQTKWFLLACIAATLLLLRLLYLQRLRQVTGRLRERLEARTAEREAIARNLHDTLLQSMQGLIFRLQAISERFPEDEPRRAELFSALDRGDILLAQGRDQVLGLNASSIIPNDVLNALIEWGNDLSKERKTVFKVTVQGQRRNLNPIVAEDTCYIGFEALTNSFKHSQGTEVQLEVSFHRTVFTIRIQDDGVGIDDTQLVAGGCPGHFGLSNMRDRAKNIRARLEVWSRRGAGTEVLLEIPAKVAYQSTGNGRILASFERWLKRATAAIR
jgi:signal transduction histidine kinase